MMVEQWAILLKKGGIVRPKDDLGGETRTQMELGVGLTREASKNKLIVRFRAYKYTMVVSKVRIVFE